MASDTEDAGELFPQLRTGGLATSLTGVSCQDQLGALPRTLSTSVLRIKPRPSFWDNLWRDRRQKDS